jgi:hypothetical protein
MSGSEPSAGDEGRNEPFCERLAQLSGHNILVSGPPMAGKSELVARTVAASTGCDRDALVVKTTGSSPDGFAAAADGDGRLGVVDCTPGGTEWQADRTTSVGSPGDLTGISMPVSEFVDACDGSPVVTVDSVSSMLMYADLSVVFRFLSVLTAQVRRQDGLGVYTFEEETHDDQAVGTIRQIFDAHAEVHEGCREARVEGISEMSDGWFAY